MKTFIIFGLLFACLCIRYGAIAKRGFTIIYRKTETRINPKEFSHMNCTVNQTSNTIDCYFHMLRDVQNDHFSHMRLARKNKNNEFEVFFINVTVNSCQVLLKQARMSSSTSSVKALFENYVAHSNLPRLCPIKKGYYHLKDFGRLEEIFPAYSPRNVYLFSMIFYRKFQNKMRFAAECNVHADLVTNKRTG